MSARSRRRRALLLLSLALTAGGLAASAVAGRERELEARVGSPLPVAVARTEVPAGTRVAQSRAFEVRRVPAAFVPPDALADPTESAGLRLAVPLARGSYLTASALAAPVERDPPGGGLRPGERAVEVGVRAAAGASGVAPGALVDVLVTSEPRPGSGGRAYVALERVELLDIRAGAPDPGGLEAAGAAGAVATLRVTARQAVFLTAAAGFARELRLLARPSRDRRRLGPLSVESGEL